MFLNNNIDSLIFSIKSICAKSDNDLIATKIGFSSVNFVPTAIDEKSSSAKVTMTTLVKPTLTTIPESKVNWSKIGDS